MISTLTFTTLFPNSAQPRHGIFIQNRLHHLLQTGAVKTQVVAPVPWFPWSHPRFGPYGVYARVPAFEQHEHYAVWHPRYLAIPKVGMNVAPYLLAWHCGSVLAKALRNAPAQLIDAHYFYPDGVAAAMLGRRFNLPVIISARGTDINVIPSHAWPRRLILWAAAQAAAIVTVCAALKTSLIGMGVAEDKITVLRNGVDLHRFQPLQKLACREKLGHPGGRLLLSVGNLVPLKGHHLAIKALKALPDTVLWIIGEGAQRQALQRQAQSAGLQQRVRFFGHITQAELPVYYSAADALVLASSREGWANVLLEAMACGTPVVATDVGGTAEVVADPAAGVLLRTRDVPSLVQAITHLFAHYPLAGSTRAYAQQFSWDATSQGQIELFQRVLAKSKA